MDTDSFSERFFTDGLALSGEVLGGIGEEAQHADLFFEQSLVEEARYCSTRRRITKTLHRRREEGFAAHVIAEESHGHAWMDGSAVENLFLVAGNARETARIGPGSRSVSLNPPVGNDGGSPPEDSPDDLLLDVARQLVNTAEIKLPETSRLEAVVQFGSVRRMIVGLDGFLGIRQGHTSNIRLDVRDEKGNIAYDVAGHRLGISTRSEVPDFNGLAARIKHRLEARGRSREVPAGSFPVVLASGWGGVWLHEVIGHLLEADNTELRNMAGLRLENRVSDLPIKLSDDATLASGRGSYTFDDEGVAARSTPLIEDGILRGLLTDRSASIAFGFKCTGNGRRQNYQFPPLPRMTNLVMDSGTASLDDLFAEAGTGVYVTSIESGSLDPRAGTYEINMLGGSMIERGRLTHPISDLVLCGHIESAIRSIQGVAGDYRMDSGRGWCDKQGQIVPVSVGMPSILLDSVTVAPR